MKNWITYATGHFVMKGDALVWEETGSVSIDPASVTTVVEVDLPAPHVVIAAGVALFAVRQRREEVVADIQRALS